ncbi:ribonuclease H-like domain-containing protein [Tanacetum coccineum]
MAEQDTPPPTITAMKIPIIKKGGYDIWSMRMRQYICHTDHNLWDIIIDEDLQEEVAPAGEQPGPPTPKTAKQLTAKRNQERVKSILLLAIPDEYLFKFHNVLDAKSLWAAIKSRTWLFFLLRILAALIKLVLPVEILELVLLVELALSLVSSTPCADEVMCSFFAQQTTSPQLKNEDLQQIDEDDLEELDLRWQVAMLTVRVKKFIQKTGRNLDFKGKQPVGFDKPIIKCYNCHKKEHFARECKSGRNQGKRSYGDNGRRNAPTNESSSQALVAQDGLGGYDWSNNFDVGPVNYALMAISSSSPSSSSENEYKTVLNNV